MKTFLSLAIPAWIGWAGGALTDNQVPEFWKVWFLIGICLLFATLTYIYDRRSA